MTPSNLSHRLWPKVLAPLALVAGIMYLDPAPAEAQRAWSVEIDNDAMNVGRRTDVDYTHGMRLRLRGANATPIGQTLFGAVPGCGVSGGRQPCQDGALVITQEIYTPEITRVQLRPGDRAYAGWLGAAMQTSIHRERTVHRFSLTVGITGAASLAEVVQAAVHRAIGSPPPARWGEQLGTEPTLDVVYDGSIDLLHPHVAPSLGARITPTWVASLGTVHREAALGVEGALELGAPGVSRWRQFSARSPASGLYLVGLIKARAVAGNLFLDGGFFRSGRTVGHLPLVTVVEFGAGLRTHGVGLEWRMVRESRDYSAQAQPHSYTKLAILL
jgi:hypothetical protein